MLNTRTRGNDPLPTVLKTDILTDYTMSFIILLPFEEKGCLLYIHAPLLQIKRELYTNRSKNDFTASDTRY